jgi:processive 1,2-diacylglycerol beta-glucosyltransferase
MLPEPSPRNLPPVAVCLEEELYSPVSYVRVIRHLQDLTERYRIAVFILPGQIQEALAYIPSAALLIMARNRHETSLLAARRAAAAHVPILFDVDDYIWEFPDYSKVERHARICTDDILNLAACVTTPSETLAERIRSDHPGKEVRLLPNAGNIWSDSHASFVPCVMANSDFFRMPEMKADFFRSIRDAAREAGKTILLYYFSNDPPEQYTDDPSLRVIWTGFRSYSSYKQLLDHIRPAFGFVLLRDEKFSRHKSVIKFAEFGYCGTIGIYSRVAPYIDFIEEGVTGFMADNTPDAWKDAVLRALSMDDAARTNMRATIAQTAAERFDYAAIHETFQSFVTALAQMRHESDVHSDHTVPPLLPFAFRDAYAYAAWMMYVEAPRLRHKRDRCRRKNGLRLKKKIARFWARIVQSKQQRNGGTTG